MVARLCIANKDGSTNVAINWTRVSQKIDPTLGWSPAICRCLWKYVAYGLDVRDTQTLRAKKKRKRVVADSSMSRDSNGRGSLFEYENPSYQKSMMSVINPRSSATCGFWRTMSKFRSSGATGDRNL